MSTGGEAAAPAFLREVRPSDQPADPLKLRDEPWPTRSG